MPQLDTLESSYDSDSSDGAATITKRSSVVGEKFFLFAAGSFRGGHGSPIGQLRCLGPLKNIISNF